MPLFHLRKSTLTSGGHLLQPSLISSKLPFFKKRFFGCGPFLKSLLNILQYCSFFFFFNVLAFLVLILAPQPGIVPTPLALEGEVLTTGPPGKPLKDAFYN